MNQKDSRNLMPLSFSDMLEKVVDDEDKFLPMMSRLVGSHLPYFIKLLDDFECDLAASIIQKEDLETFEIENWLAIKLSEESCIVIYTKSDGQICSNRLIPC